MGKDSNEQDRAAKDNRNRPDQENSTNGLDSLAVRGSEDGRNDRPVSGNDMDSANGVLRFNDRDDTNSTDDVTEEGMNTVAASNSKTNTSTVDVTTHGPDDYPSAGDTPTPKAQKKAKQQDKKGQKSKTDQVQEKTEKDVARTGTATEHKPVY